MAPRRKPRCFVAIAFGRADTDLLVNLSIVPVLRANGVEPVIVNRREDNRDLNAQIIEQLDVCDFCISDLTYARPSVYFEAGYAQRAVEVIYTVRSDHLEANQPEDRRVHFDLTMKPLIRWSVPEEGGFRRRLERRIRSTFLRKWEQLKKEREVEAGEREAFARMALAERLTKLRRGAVAAICKLGFARWNRVESHMGLIYPIAKKDVLALGGGSNWWAQGVRRDGELVRIVSVRVEESLTLKKLRDEFGGHCVSRMALSIEDRDMIRKGRPANRAVEHHILGSIRAVPNSRVMSGVPSLTWDAGKLRYWVVGRWGDVRHGGAIARQVYVYKVDDIRSLREFRARMGRILKEIVGGREGESRQARRG